MYETCKKNITQKFITQKNITQKKYHAKKHTKKISRKKIKQKNNVLKQTPDERVFEIHTLSGEFGFDITYSRKRSQVFNTSQLPREDSILRTHANWRFEITFPRKKIPVDSCITWRMRIRDFILTGKNPSLFIRQLANEDSRLRLHAKNLIRFIHQQVNEHSRLRSHDKKSQ